MQAWRERKSFIYNHAFIQKSKSLLERIFSIVEEHLCNQHQEKQDQVGDHEREPPLPPRNFDFLLSVADNFRQIPLFVVLYRLDDEFIVA